MPRHLRSVDDLPLDEFDRLIERSRELDGVPVPGASRFSAGLVFLTSSLRTRVGFTTAAHRLGGTTVDVHEPRYSEQMSAAESVPDLLRTVSGMVDVTVLRSALPLEALDLPRNCVSAFVNAGDASWHPTQTLIDVRAIQDERGDHTQLHVAMVGDVTMRAARSLLQLFSRRPPDRLTVIGPPTRLDHGVALGPTLEARTTIGRMGDVLAADVVYLIGLAPGLGSGRIEDHERLRYQLTLRVLGQLADDAVVISPLPVIDEIADAARPDPRVRFWGPSDRSVSVRMAVLEHVLSGTPSP